MPPEYKLKKNSETRRQIKLGNTVDEVKKQYGVPFKSNLDKDGNGSLVYTTVFIPNSGAGTRMVFEFEGGVLIEVAIHLM